MSSHLLRGTDPRGRGIIAVAAGHPKRDTQLYAYVDALHWANSTGKAVRLIIEDPATQITDGLALLHRGAAGNDAKLTFAKVDLAGQETNLELDSDPVIELGTGWHANLNRQERARKPGIIATIDALLGEGCLDWYPSFSSDTWSGRVAGLEICKVDGDGARVAVGARVGQTERKLQTQIAEIIRTITGDATTPLRINPRDGADSPAVRTLKALIEARLSVTGDLAKSYPEHRLESRIWRRDLSVPNPLGGHLAYLTTQFPTRWASDSPTRLLDVLMRDGSTPWAVELKVDTGGKGTYLRHAVAQAALYRESIRMASDLDEWFAGHGLDRSRCEALLVIPKILGRNANALKSAVLFLADVLSVHVIAESELEEASRPAN